MSESDSSCFLSNSRKMSVSSDSCTGDGDTVDSNVKIQINDITPSNSQEFFGPWDDDCYSGDHQRLRKRSIDAIKLSRKKMKKELVRRQSWSSLREDIKLQKPTVQKCWSLSSLDSDTEEIFYDARDGPCTPIVDTSDPISQSLVERMKAKQRSFSAGSKEDILMAICEQVSARQNDPEFNEDAPVVRDDKKKHSLAALTTSQPTGDEEWLLAPRTPLQKSISTPSIIAAQEIQEMARRRDRDGRERPLSTSFSTNQLSFVNLRDSSIAMLREEDEPEEMNDNTIIPQLSLATLLRQSLLGSGYQDSDDDKPFSKRKKRGSLFFRKKRNKDKDSKKASTHQFVSICYSTSAVCDSCSKALANKSAVRCEICLVAVHDSSCKDHVPDCKSRVSKLQSPTVKDKGAVPLLQVSLGRIRHPSRYRHLLGPVSLSLTDLASGKSQQTREKRLSVGNNSRPQSLSMIVSSTETKLGTPPNSKIISEEKEAEPHEEPNSNLLETNSGSLESLEDGQDISDIEDETMSQLMDEEADAWNTSVDKKVIKKLRERDVKRQEAIYEFILTEKHHCLTLKVMQKVFSRGMMKELNFSKERIERIFPCLDELLDIHVSLYHRLRERQKQETVVSIIGDILVDQFQGKTADQMRFSYSQFCSQHKEALSLYKDILKSDRKFQSFIKKCASKPVCKARGIPECILLVTQRVTKYPLLLDALIKTSKDNKTEIENLTKALSYVKAIIADVNTAVAEREREERLLEIYNKIDAKSTASYRNKKFKKSDLIRSESRKLQFEGPLAWKNARGKTIDVHAVVLSDVIVLLQENNQKYHFASLDNKPAVLSLQKLLVREKAGQNSRGIYLISSNPNDPEMYELICPTSKEKRLWVQVIRESVEKCPEDVPFFEDAINDKKVDYRKHENREKRLKELFGLLYEKDMGVAQLCEEKTKILIETLEIMGYDSDRIENFSYSSLLSKDDDETKYLLMSALTNANKLVSCLYSSGSALSRCISSAGEHQSSVFVSPVLPKRAETFGGFDNSIKDGASKMLLLKKKLLLFKENDNSPSTDRELSFSDSNLHTKGCDSQGTCTPKLGSKQSSPDKTKHFLSSGTLSPKSNDNDSQMSSQLNLSESTRMELLAELSHYVSVVTCLVNHHFSSIESVYARSVGNSEKKGKSKKDQSERKSFYKPNNQLEELRNIQEQLNEERERWLAERSCQEAELASKMEELLSLKEQLQNEQCQLTLQKEQINRQIEALQREGITLSPSLCCESISDDDSSYLDISQHQRHGASFDLQPLQQLSMSRQSWSGPGSEEQRQLPSSRFLLSLSASNLPLSVESGSNQLSKQSYQTCSQETQWCEDDYYNNVSRASSTTGVTKCQRDSSYESFSCPKQQLDSTISNAGNRSDSSSTNHVEGTNAPFSSHDGDCRRSSYVSIADQCSQDKS